MDVAALALPLLGIEAWLETLGWGRLPTVMSLLEPHESLPHGGQLGEPDAVIPMDRVMESVDAPGWTEYLRALSPADRAGSDAELHYAVLGEGDPYEVLASAPCPTHAIALVVAVEGWTWPDDVPDEERTGRPSEHPDRVEVRQVIAVTSTREVAGVTRVRGDEPSFDTEGGGRLVEAMHSALAAAATKG